MIRKIQLKIFWWKNQKWITNVLAIISVPLAAWLFMYSKMPEPLNINKIMEVQTLKSEYTKEDIEFLNSIGFSSATTTVDNINVLRHNETKKEVATKYGLNFINENIFKKNIAEKYNMIIAPLSTYIRNIPKKNVDELRERLNFIKKVDGKEQSQQHLYHWLLRRYGSDERIYLSSEEIRADWAAAVMNNQLVTSTPTGGHVLLPQFVELYNSMGIDLDRYILEYIEKGEKPSPNSVVTQNFIYPLFVCAPKSYFNLEGVQTVDGLSYFFPQPKDPIVLAKYKEGYIILTAWDE
jgi:hypothetical protein